MKTKLKLFQAPLLCGVALGIGSSFSLAVAAADSAETAPAKTSIPWSQLGAKAGADYQGDGLAVNPTAGGAWLRCVFQRLEGEATPEGLWLTSTVIPPSGTVNDRSRIVVAEVTRLTSNAGVHSEPALERMEKRQRTAVLQNLSEFPQLQDSAKRLGVRLSSAALAAAGAKTVTGLGIKGTVAIEGQTVRFTRPGLVEEYSVSMDGVRQDFIIEHPPLNSQLSTLNQRAGELAVQLAVSGARVEPAAGGAQMVLENSGRKIAYSRLRVTDATGKELTARMEIIPLPIRWGEGWGEGLVDSNVPTLAVVVNDADAVYPVRIDPTFSDVNWISMGGIPGADGHVEAAVVDDSGSLYIGGRFTIIGDVIANYIAKWNGSSWSALGSWMNNSVSALAVSGSDLYAGGRFTTAGGKVSAYVARAIVYPPVLAIEGDGDSGYFIRFSGVPGSAYRLERAPGLSGPWTAIGPQTAPASGLVEFWDRFPPPGQGFYRSVQP